MLTMPSNSDTDDHSTGTRALSIDVPARSPNDEVVHVRITGAAPGSTVEFRAALVDDEDREWVSRATYTADEAGTVDCGDQAPERGTYECAAPMGWLWSMRTDTETPFASLGDRAELSVTLQASTDSAAAEREVTRVLFDSAVGTRRIGHEDIVGRLFLPPDEGPHPAVIDLHGSGGPRSHRLARTLATHGFAVCSLQYFGAPDPLPDELARVPLSYFDEAADWLRDQPAVRGDRLGVVGASRGAELALLLGARTDWVGAVVSYAGSGVVWDTPDGTPAWVDDGERVPHLSGEGAPERTDDGRVLTRPVLERGFENASEAARREATIPVERIDGPVLLLSGGSDPVWPARRLSSLAAERLERHDFPHTFDHLTYDGCGHLIGVPHVPFTGVQRGSVSARATAHAATDSWPVVLESLDRGLNRE
jgi:dienelactone hydrolase